MDGPNWSPLKQCIKIIKVAEKNHIKGAFLWGDPDLDQ